MVFARNPHFWRTDAAGAQLQYLDKLTVLILPDQNAEALRMQTGEIDLMRYYDGKKAFASAACAALRLRQSRCHRTDQP